MATMRAQLLTGHGDFDRLEWRTDVPVPTPGPGEVLIRVRASSVNNTDINTRIGWYAQAGSDDGSWTGEGLKFPLIQGIDIAGTIESVGSGVDASRIGERVIVQSCLTSRRKDGVSPFVGSEINGGFAEFAVAPAADCFAITVEMAWEELGAIPCAYGTAVNMLTEAGVRAGDHVLVTGASGNVGLAALQLAILRGATVTAAANPSKQARLIELGAADCVASDLSDLQGVQSRFDVVIDLVGGEDWGRLFELMKPFGRLAISGAIGGAFPRIDLRLLYLKNLRLFGCTEQSRASFEHLVSLINAGRVHPVIHSVYPMSRLIEAQQEFLRKAHVGKIVLVPD